MDTYQALYYPYIHFKNDAWLKLSALYWDKVHRIVPNDYATHDSDTVKSLGSFVDTIRPDGAHPAFGKAFVEFISRYAPKLREKYSLLHRAHWPVLPETQRPPMAGGTSGTDLRLGYVFYEKIDGEVRVALEQSGLALTDEHDERWIGMHPRLAWVYMTALAEQIAGERGLRPLTDETRDHVAASGLSPERLAQALLGDAELVDTMPSASEVESVLVSVAFKAVVPVNLGDLDVGKILAFREKYPKERTEFQKAASDLLKSSDWLKTIHDPKVLEQRLRDEYDKMWADRLRDLRAQLDEVGISTLFSCFNVKTVVPAGIAGAAAVMNLPFNAIAAGAATVAVGAIAALKDKRKTAQEALEASPMTYLYRMERDLAPKELWERVRRRALEFALGA